jgi:hypothetical protein
MDSGPMEAFWGTLKAGMCCPRHFGCFGGLRTAVESHMVSCSNSRCQEQPGGSAPLEFRALLLAAGTVLVISVWDPGGSRSRRTVPAAFAPSQRPFHEFSIIFQALPLYSSRLFYII